MKKFFQKFLNNQSDQPIKYWLYQQSPGWFRVNIVWRIDNIKDDIRYLIDDLFPNYYSEWVEGFISKIDEKGIWICWSDDDTFIPYSKKKWIKLFEGMSKGDTFRCHYQWSIRKDKPIRIKDVELIYDDSCYDPIDLEI